jgi:signal transduction histidine kinase
MECGPGLTYRMGVWIGRLVEALGRMQPGLALVAIAATIAFGWLGTYLAGGAVYAAPHWFYVPILFAATRFGLKGAVATALVSGVVAGPLTPSDVDLGIGQAASDEIVRATYFLVIGTLMATVIWRLEEALSREAGVARREAELAAHKDAVISTVSHEFRTPLAVVLGSAKLLLRQREWPELERTLLEGISGSALRLNDLVAAVLAVSEGPLVAEELVSVRVPLAPVVSAVVTGMDPRDTDRVQVQVGDVAVWGDPAILEALLRQLVDNALKFSPTTSPVQITARPSEGDVVEVVIADRGPGIETEFLPRAFDPFTQQDGSLRRSSGGLGIGLFVAHRLSEYLGSQLELRPRAGGGIEARVSLRRAMPTGVDLEGVGAPTDNAVNTRQRHGSAGAPGVPVRQERPFSLGGAVGVGRRGPQ